MIRKRKLGCIIFARYNSRRLRGKVLKNICNKPLLEIIYLRLTKVFSKNNIVVATTKDKDDKNIIQFCKKNKINYFCGSKNNLIKRSIECSKKNNFYGFARICGDRPFLDYSLLKKMVKKFNENSFDLVTNCYPKTYPSGFTNEIITVKALEKTQKFKLLKSEKEHMLNFIYKDSEKFRIFNFKSKLNKKIIQKNFSINNYKDLSFARKIYKNYNNNYFINSNKILKSFNI
tara:strand:+ start:100 stop:792 length:693 start_codon:yes stop_codon:yes gene_type:complete